MTTTAMPHSTDRRFLTDAGFETWLLFQRGFDLPCFAAFPLMRQTEGRAAMKEYFAAFMELARQHDTGFVLDTVTWRANPDWGRELGYSLGDLRTINREAVEFASELRRDFGAGMNVLINGVIGPRGDGYDPGEIMTSDEAEAYHRFQIRTFAESGADMVSAVTMTNAPEAVGIARAAGGEEIPCVISFTVETDGRLPSGQALSDAIAETDAACDRKPAYYMINCAHPDHFCEVLAAGGDWTRRIHGVRANASRMSHAELDACEELDDGNPPELGRLYSEMRRHLPNLNVFGGCCGTDHRHVAHICDALRAA